MSAPVVQGSNETWTPPPAKPLDEVVWQAWVAKNREQDQRGSDSRMKALKWASILSLFVAAALGSQLAPYDVVVRFIVMAGGIATMFQAHRAHRIAYVAVFGAIATLYNPVMPVFTFSGTWQHALVAASTIPFIATLTGRDVRVAHND